MDSFPKVLVFAGIALIVVGLIWIGMTRWGIRLGKLPGDIAIEKENVKFYFPIVSSIVVSLVLSLLLAFFRRFK